MAMPKAILSMKLNNSMARLLVLGATALSATDVAVYWQSPLLRAVEASEIFPQVGTNKASTAEAGKQLPGVDALGDPLPPGALLRLGSKQLRASVASVAFAADGKKIFTVAWDGMVREWDAQTGIETRHWDAFQADPDKSRARSNWVKEVIPSSDGKVVAAVRSDETVVVWDAVTAKEKYRIPKATSVALSADGKMLACAFLDYEAGWPRSSTIGFFDTASGKKVRDISINLSIGPFCRLELVEIDDCVYCVCRTAQEEFAVVSLDLQERSLMLHFHLASEEVANQADRVAQIRASMTLLLAAVVRDFWVVEERERVFATKQDTSGPRRLLSDDGPAIVYLPRIKYVGQPDTARCEAELDQQERRAHFVRAHMRKADHPSEWQKALAGRYGFSLPVGYTFVRPHERGKTQRDIIYRSRSALQSLYDVVEHDAGGPVDWFQFERDIYKLMERLGFAVEHVALAKRGDHGVDVFATKGKDFDEVKWIIQCKCYAPHRKCGPDTVRELAGSLEQYPTGTRGMIATTSSFTRGARKEAETLSIRLMDGKEFHELIQATPQA
jgi:hypothetical protein